VGDPEDERRPRAQPQELAGDLGRRRAAAGRVVREHLGRERERVVRAVAGGGEPVRPPRKERGPPAGPRLARRAAPTSPPRPPPRATCPGAPGRQARRPPPSRRDGERSTTKKSVCSRSSSKRLTVRRPARAVTFQSSVRASSPGT